MSEHWYQFFSRFFNKPDPEESISVGLSPFSFQATSIGSVRINGTVTSVEVTRNGITYYNLGATQGLFTIGNNDILRVTFPAAAPLMTFFPL